VALLQNQPEKIKLLLGEVLRFLSRWRESP